MTEKLSNETARTKEIAVNIEKVRANIAAAAERSGRPASDITLVAVTKTMPASDVAVALGCGVEVFGENRVQELLSKLPELDMRGKHAHLIGHLQTNKVRSVIGKVDLIQSVDSLHLAKEIDRQGALHNLVTDVLIEVNIGGEASKTGVAPGDLEALLSGTEQLGNIRICGLMAIPPFNENRENTRNYFAKMRELFIDIGKKKSDNRNMHILSMGMSSDYEVAIEEGANMVRVGTAIFGRR